MKRLTLPKQAYPLDSNPELYEDLLNLFVEAVPSEGRSDYMLRSTPGAEQFVQHGTGPISAMSDLHGLLYFVSGNEAYRINSNGNDTLLGNVLPSTSATIAIGPNQVVFCTEPNAYYATHDGYLTQITGEDLPGFSSVAYLDGYFLFSVSGGGQFYVSHLLDGATIDPLDFASQEAMPDVVKRGVSHLGLYWLFGADVVEVWYDAGAADFPFRRQTGAVIYSGTTSPASIARLDNGLCWLGRDNIVYQTDGLQARRISNHALEQAIVGYGDTVNAQGCSYTQEGHKFYSITFPNAANGMGATWVYDAATKLWHRRSSFVGVPGRWRAQTAAQFGQSAVIGDYASGKLFFLAPNSSTDNGLTLQRMAQFPPIVNNQQRVFMNRFEVEMEVGTSLTPTLMLLDWSDNGGATFSSPRLLDMGALNARRTRPFTTRLGSFRQRILRMTANGYATIYAADADMTAGAS